MRRWWWILCLPLLLQGALVQDPHAVARPALRVSSSAEGLPGDSVYDLLLDRQGRLWAGTLEGPARFTGSQWVSVPLPKAADSQHVRTLLETRDGSLWFGTQAGGVWRLTGEVWTHFTAPAHLPSDRINCLMETVEAGVPTLWVGTAGGGIARFRSGQWSQVDRELGLTDPWIWRLQAIPDGQGRSEVWAAAYDGLWRLRGGRWERIGAAQGLDAPSTNDVVAVVDEDGGTRVWVSCWGRGLACWDGQRWTHSGPAQGFPSAYPTRLAVTRDGAGRPILWAGTFDAGIAWLQDGRWQRFGPREGFPVVGAYSLLPVPGGRPTLWAGTRGSGVVSVDLGGWRSLDGRSGLPSAEVTTFQALQEGRTETFWVGTTRGLARWQEGAWHVETRATGLPEEYVFHLAVTRRLTPRPTLWAGTLRGLMRREGTQWRLVRDPALFPSTANVVHVDEEGPEPRLWVGHSLGLVRFEQGRWTRFTAADGLPGNWIQSLHTTRDRQGRSVLWVGTRGQGIGRFQQGAWTRYGAQDGLPAQAVAALASTRSSDGRTWLWAGTQGGGLARLEVERPGASWEPIPLGASSRSIVGLRQVADGRLYVTTTRGVLRCLLTERAGVPWPELQDHFTTGDGLPSNTLQTRALYEDAAGRLWVGSALGAAVLDPRTERRLPDPPTPTLEVVEASGRRYEPGASLTFTHRDTRVIFRYALNTFHRREDTLYRTRVEGLERDWTGWQSETVRELTGLPSGHYALLVSAQTFQGRVTPTLRIPFVVKPAPWRSPLAYVFYGLGLAGAIWMVVILRTAYLRRRQAELEAEVQAALAEVKTLQGLLPICAYCKKIRDDQGAWAQLEQYLGEHSGATFSHGICPDCRAKFLEEANRR